MVFEVSRLQKWSKNDQKHGKILSERVFSALEASQWLKTMVFTRVCAPSQHKTRKLRWFWATYASKSSRVASNHAIYSCIFFLWRFFGFWRFQSPPVWQSGLKPRNSAKEPRKNLWLLKCLGFKNGRKMTKNMERFCWKGFFRLLEASQWLKTMVCTRALLERLRTRPVVVGPKHARVPRSTKPTGVFDVLDAGGACCRSPFFRQSAHFERFGRVQSTFSPF